MSAREIERIMMLALCSEKDAKDAYEKTQDVVEACDLLLQVPETKGAPKKNNKVEPEAFTKMRKDMEEIDKELMHLSQPVSSSRVSSRILYHAQEETMLRSHCIRSSHLAALEEEEQKQETVYR